MSKYDAPTLIAWRLALGGGGSMTDSCWHWVAGTCQNGEEKRKQRRNRRHDKKDPSTRPPRASLTRRGTRSSFVPSKGTLPVSTSYTTIAKLSRGEGGVGGDVGRRGSGGDGRKSERRRHRCWHWALLPAVRASRDGRLCVSLK